MVPFDTKNSDSGMFWKALEWKLLLYVIIFCYFMAIWYILYPRCTYVCHEFIWYIFGVSVRCTKTRAGICSVVEQSLKIVKNA
jgi:hypothetical protein